MMSLLGTTPTPYTAIHSTSSVQRVRAIWVGGGGGVGGWGRGEGGVG
jgi:hypothetical protein